MKFLVILIFLIQSCWAGFAGDDFAHWYYKTKAKYQSWKYIVLHHSATDSGSVKSFHRYHTNQGYGGIAYHFVIGNGKGMKDGEVAETYRWKEQMAGTHVTVDSWEYNVFGIGICIVGNLEKKPMTKKQKKALQKLIRKLMKKYRIAAGNVITHADVPFDDDPGQKQKTKCPGKFLNIKEFRFHIC